MSLNTIKKYATNCFLLTIPIMIWNIVLTSKLPKDFQPEIFWKDIPTLLTYGENISRALVFMLTFLMPLRISTPTQKKGLYIYLGGVLLYFASWLVLILFPDSKWSNSTVGFTAPSYTPLIWLIGIGLIGDSFYFNWPFRRWFFVLISILFLLFHNFHAFTIYSRTH
ncbi:hypothetical protein [Runella zeae]|uniref:hypothetical protein n=1 Tax=Runella zeae TaxID=94255 RepID=UPI00041B5060|nr:hypothetical protein [Runella zeae]